MTTLADSGPESLRQCILDANATPEDDTITFKVTGTINLISALPNLSTTIDIQGPGAANLTVQRGTATPFRIFVVSSGATVGLSGLTIGNGFAPTTGPNPNNGGGILNSGLLTLNNATVSGNHSSTSAGNGGGIYNAGTTTLNNSTVISGNSARNGGGIYNASGGAVMLNNTTVSGNPAFRGGGIYNNSFSTLTLNNTTVSGNPATGSGSVGGGIYNAGTVTLNNSTVSGNSVSGGSFPDGGGIYNTSGTVTLNNATVSGNSAYRGGGIYSNSGTVTLNNATVTDNFASSTGRGIHRNSGALNARNSIIAGNNPPGGDLFGPVTSGSHNLIGGNPLLGRLHDNGGPTLTHIPLPGSPAIDAGDNAFSPGPFDQRGPGFPRIVAGTIDIGAVEVQIGPVAFFYLYPDSGPVERDVAFDLYVFALDAYGHVVTDYADEVFFWSPDEAAVLPVSYTFRPEDGGVAYLPGAVAFGTPGLQKLYVFDAAFTALGLAIYEVL